MGHMDGSLGLFLDSAFSNFVEFPASFSVSFKLKVSYHLYHLSLLKTLLTCEFSKVKCP